MEQQRAGWSNRGRHGATEDGIGATEGGMEQQRAGWSSCRGRDGAAEGGMEQQRAGWTIPPSLTRSFGLGPEVDTQSSPSRLIHRCDSYHYTDCVYGEETRRECIVSAVRPASDRLLAVVSFLHYLPFRENEVFTALMLFVLACVCIIRGVPVNAAKSGLRGILLPSDVTGVYFRKTSRSLVCSSSCAPQATRRRTRYVVVCLLYEPVAIIHSLLLTTRILRHFCVPWNAFQFDTQGKGSIVGRNGSR
jgi:hypothetical protein